MCWSFTASIVSAVFSTLVGLFLISRNKFPFLFYGISLLGVTSMQYAEAYLWYYGDVTNDKCTIENRFGTQVLVPIAVLLQPLAPYIGGLISTSNKKFSGIILRDYQKYYIGFLSIFKLHEILYYYVTNGEGFYWWQKTLCTIVTNQGYLYWGATDKLLFLCIWWMIVSFPVIVTMTNLKGVSICLYGLFAVFASYFLTDSTGSNWCLYIVAYSVFGIIDWYRYP